MKSNQKLSLLITLASLAVVSAGQAQTVVYDNLGTSPTAGYGEANANHPIFGDALNLSQGGQIGNVGLSIYNAGAAGNTGTILTGNLTINIYNNTTAYAGGALSSLPLLGTVTEALNFGTGLPLNNFADVSFNLSAQNINVPQNIFITQQFTETSGTSTANGVVLFGDPTIGTSPENVYVNSSGTPEGLYSFSGIPSQFGYHIEVVVAPEPSTLALAGLAVAVLVFRRRK
jgi:hypothetical protein